MSRRSRLWITLRAASAHGMLWAMRSDAISPLDLLPLLRGDGIGTRADWLAAGATRRMFTDGRLRKVVDGLYVAAADPRPITPKRLASILPAEAVIGGWAAAQSHGVRDAGPTMLEQTGTIAIAYISRNDSKSVPGFGVLRSDLADHEIVYAEGMPITSALRTAYDLVRFAPGLSRAVGLLDAFLFEGNPFPVRADDLLRLVRKRPRSRGNPQVRAALDLASSRSRSFPESGLRVRLISELGLGPGQLWVNATLHARRTWELDLIDLSSGLVIEYDGPHHDDPQRQRLDDEKDGDLSDLELVPERVRSDDLRRGSDLMSRLSEQRTRAQLGGGADVVRQLVADGRLRLDPLRMYAPA